MLSMSATAAAMLLAGNQKRFIRVESWYDGQLLSDDLPIVSGSEEVDRRSNVPERVSLTVPRRADGVSYLPDRLDSPTAANGQKLRVQLGIELQTGNIEWLQRGWFLITDSEVSGDEVQIQAAGMLYKIQEAGLINPFQPTGTLAAAVTKLVEPAITVMIDPALTDRAIPTSGNYDSDRLGALNAILAAWPAVAEMNEQGYLQVSPVKDPTVSVLTLTDGVGGTVIRANGSSTRDGVYNVVVAQGQTSAGGVVRGVAYDTLSPKRFGGPFNEFPVPLYLDSPLITTGSQARQAAATRLATLRRSSAFLLDVEMVPHPGLQAGDLITLNGAAGGKNAVVEVLGLPYVAGGGVQKLTVRVV